VVRVVMLGGIAVYRPDGTAVTEWERPSALRLVCFLAATPVTAWRGQPPPWSCFPDGCQKSVQGRDLRGRAVHLGA
jgi:hypothetical protein